MQLVRSHHLSLSSNKERLLPEDGDVEIVPCSYVGCFDVMAEKNECKKQIVNVGFVHRQKDKRQIHLRWGEKEKRNRSVGKKYGILLLLLNPLLRLLASSYLNWWYFPVAIIEFLYLWFSFSWDNENILVNLSLVLVFMDCSFQLCPLHCQWLILPVSSDSRCWDTNQTIKGMWKTLTVTKVLV